METLRLLLQIHIPGASNNKYQNIYANNYYGSGLNLTDIPFSGITGYPIDYTVPTITNKPTIPANTSDLTNDSGFLTAITGQDIGNLQNVYITSVQNGHVLKYNSTSEIGKTEWAEVPRKLYPKC